MPSNRQDIRDGAILYTSEASRYSELQLLQRALTTSGNLEFISASSTATYNSTTGEAGLLTLLAVPLANRLISASDINEIGDISTLTTTADTDLVVAVNEVDANVANVENEVDLLKTFPTVGGSVNAITLTTPTSQNFDYTIDGNPIVFIPTGSNTASATINVDGQGVRTIVKPDGSGGTTATEADDLPAGVPVKLYRRVSSNFFLLAPSGGANVSVTTGTTILPAGTGEINNISIPTVDLTKAWVKFTVTAGNNQVLNSTSVRGYFASNSLLGFKRIGTSGTVTIEWEVIEDSNATVQSGNISKAAAQIFATISSVDLSKSELFFSNEDNNSNSLNSQYLMSGRLFSSTNILFSQNLQVSTQLITYFVVTH